MINLHGFKRVLALVFMVCLAVSSWADVAEMEPNDDAASAQNLNGGFALGENPDVGDSAGNTSATIPHVTVTGKGSGPQSADYYRFTVTEAGKGTFDIDYGVLGVDPDRFGIATQLDGTVWIKNEKDFLFLDDKLRPQWAFRTIYPDTLHNVLTVHPETGLFYSINRGTNNLVSIDPMTGVSQDIGDTGVDDITALAFNVEMRLFAVTGSDDFNSSLYELDPGTGAMIALIGDTGTSAIKGIDFNPLTGELIGVAGETNLDLRNSLTTDSSGNFFSLGRVYGPDGREIFLYRLDVETGEVESLGSTGLSDLNAITFNDADELYASSGSGGDPSLLYRLDPQTGAVVETIGDMGIFGVTGIDFDPGTDSLYAFANGLDNFNLDYSLTSDNSGVIHGIFEGEADYLITIDQSDPYLVNFLGPLSGDLRQPAIAMDGNNRLFAVAEQSGPGNDDTVLFELDPLNGAVISEIGSTGFSEINSVAFDPVSGTLFAHADSQEAYIRNGLASDSAGNFYSFGTSSRSNGDTIFKLDIDTSVAISVGSPGLSGIAAIAFDAGDRMFVMTARSGDGGVLYELDRTTGQVLELIGDTGLTGVTGLDFHPASGALYAHANGESYRTRNVLATDSNGVVFTLVEPDKDCCGYWLATVEPTTGEPTLLGMINAEDLVALAFDSDDRLFATTGSDASPSTLLEINPLNGGTVASIGDIGFNGVTGLAFHPDTNILYGHTHSPNQLITIDATTGVGSLIGASGLGSNLPDMAFNSGTGVLYGVSDNSLYTLDLLTGAANLVTEVDPDGDRRAISWVGEDLYVKFDSRIYRIDPADGSELDASTIRRAGQLATINTENAVATFVASTRSERNVPDISFDPADNGLYGWDRDNSDLVRIDIVTGEFTMVGDSGVGGSRLGLAFSGATGELLMKSGERVYGIDTSDGLATFKTSMVSSLPVLLTLDTSTGAGTVVGQSLGYLEDEGNWASFSDLAFDTNSAGSNPNYGTLYGNERSSGKIYVFDTDSGAATLLGDVSGNCCSAGLVHDGTTLLANYGRSEFIAVSQDTGSGTFAFDASLANNQLTTLFTVNIEDASTMEIGSTEVGNISDLAFDSSGALFGWAAQDEQLLSINKETGAASGVGDSDVFGGSGGRFGLAFDDSSSTMYIKEDAGVYTISRVDGVSEFVRQFNPDLPRLLTLDMQTAETTDIGATMAYIPDIAFTQEGRLLGWENDFHYSLVEFDLANGRLTTLWRFLSYDSGLAFTSDGTLWQMLDDDYLMNMDQSTGHGTFYSQVIDLNQDAMLAIDSNDRFFVHDNSFRNVQPGPLYLMNPDSGVLTLLGGTGLDLDTIAFDSADRLFGISNRDVTSSTLYELDPSDGSIITTIGETGFQEIEAMDFHPDTGVLFAHSSFDGSLLSINPDTAETALIGPTGALEVTDLAFSAEGLLFGVFDDDDDNGSWSRAGLIRIDTTTGAGYPIKDSGNFDSKITLLDIDGVSELASNIGGVFSLGAYGSNPDDIDTELSEDAFLEYDFTVPGTYYLRVEDIDQPYIPFGGTYSLSVSLPGGLGDFMFINGFEE